MSTQNAGALSSTDTEDSEETIEISVSEYERLHERIDSLESEVERIDELEALVQALRKKVNTHVENDEREHAEIRKYATQKAEEAGSGDTNPTPDGEETTPPQEKTPIERCFDDPDTSGVRITASVQRAMRIVGRFEDWSKRVGTDGKRVVKDNLRTLLGTAGGETIAWKQVYRAGEKLEELSNGALSFKKHNKHGWMIVLEENEFLARVVSEQRRG